MSRHFLERAKETHKIHVANLRNNDNWSIEKTAKSLSRSKGSVSEDLMIIRWYRIHEKKIESFHTASDCLEWIRDKSKEDEMEDV